MSFLNLTIGIVAFDDASNNNNPQLLRPGWRKQWSGVPVDKSSVQEFHLDPLEEIVAFDGSRTLGSNGTTDYDLTNLASVDSTRYRLKWGGAGTAPAFRTARTVASSGGNIILTLNANNTVTATSSLGSIFGGVQVGDKGFVPGVSTGDTTPFSSLNEGMWNVILASAASVTLSREAGSVFSGSTETVAVTLDSQLQFFSASGVQAGDTLDIAAGFSAATQRAYEVLFVTADSVEFISAMPLADETAVPGVSGLAVYSSSKQFLYLETDQEIAVKYNGDTSEKNRVTPFLANTTDNKGFDAKSGVVYSLSIKNRSTSKARVILITCE